MDVTPSSAVWILGCAGLLERALIMRVDFIGKRCILYPVKNFYGSQRNTCLQLSVGVVLENKTEKECFASSD